MKMLSPGADQYESNRSPLLPMGVQFSFTPGNGVLPGRTIAAVRRRPVT